MTAQIVDREVRRVKYETEFSFFASSEARSAKEKIATGSNVSE